MSKITFSTLAFALGLFSLTHAHGVMDTPKPYGFRNSLTNGPMTRSGFPCKKDEVSFTNSSSNSTWSGSSSQLLHLTTAATHRGGRCFIAVTYESPGSPSFEDSSNWRNVYTIPGECPAAIANTDGSLDTITTSNSYPSGPQCSFSNSNQMDCVHSYSIHLPDELMDGAVTFAWVWLSNLTTETYMNCAPMTISGAKAKNNGKFNTLPSLQGLSFTGLAGGGPPGGLDDTGSNVSLSSIVAIPTTLAKAYISSAAATSVSSAMVVNSSRSKSSSICHDGAAPCSSSGFFCINETTFGECVSGCAVPMQISIGTACVGDAIAFANPGMVRRSATRRMSSSCNTS